MTQTTTTNTRFTAEAMTYYEALGVSSTSSFEEIKSSFYRLARLHHPDKVSQKQQQQQQQRLTPNQRHEESTNSGDEVDTNDKFDPSASRAGAHSFIEIQEAWEVLRDSSKRQEYDLCLKANRHHQQSKYDSAILLSSEDWEEAIDDETQERIWVYDCRCGQELYIDNIDDIDDNKNNQEAKKKKEIFVDCPGCCFVYCVQL
jgi:DnaJ-class molecular chaperone